MCFVITERRHEQKQAFPPRLESLGLSVALSVFSSVHSLLVVSLRPLPCLRVEGIVSCLQLSLESQSR